MADLIDAPSLTAAELLQVLVRYHTGHERGINVRDLSFKTGVSEREIRSFVTELRKDGYPICAHPSTGYFMAASSAELNKTIGFIRTRSVGGLVICSQLSRMALADYIGQLKLPT